MAQVDGFDFPVGYPEGMGWNNGSGCIEPSCASAPCTDGLSFLEPYDYGGNIGCIWHPGEDWNNSGANDCGEPVHAVANGQVIAVPEACSWGPLVIRHDDVPGYGTLWSVYGHMDAAAVPVNTNVTRGDVIGWVSNKSPTPMHCHLHFEIRAVDLLPCYFPTQAEGADDLSFITARYLNPTEFIDANRSDVECPPYYTFTGEAAGDAFGVSASGAGDVDNDGYADLIVGALWNNAGGAWAGRAYVYSGQTNALLYTFTGEAARDELGYSVSGAGDVDNDGYDDLIVGAPFSDVGGSEAGQAYVYSGQTGGLLYTFTGEAAVDVFGGSVSGAGDVDNDGHADLIIGAVGNDAGGDGVGRAYVYSGQTRALLWAFTGEAWRSSFGSSVSGAGDVDNDGHADLIVGALGYGINAGNWRAGRAYVYSGQTGALLYTFTGEAAEDEFGCSVSGAGDVNNDGYADLIVGAWRNDAGGSDAGRAYVYSGQTGLLLYTFTGETVWGTFGRSVSRAGDVDNDGYADLIVGAPQAGGSLAGLAYVYSGQTGALLYTFTGEAGGDDFGHSVSGSEDINNDGYADLIVGAYGNDAGGENAGQAYVYTCRGSVTPSPAEPQITDLLDAGTGSDLIVKWTQPDKTGVTEYQVYFGLAPGDYVFQSVLLPEDGSNEYSFVVNGLTEHTPYYVAVRAYNADADLWSTYAEAGPIRPTVPVFLIHGWRSGSPETWDDPGTTDDFRGWLEDAGFNSVYVPQLISCGIVGEEDFDLNAQNLALYIRGRISELEARSVVAPPIDRVDLVAHSMGGLVSRRLVATPEEWVPLGFTASIRNLVMLGTPNGGTGLASSFCVPWSNDPNWWSYTVCAGPAGCELSKKQMSIFNANPAYLDRHGAIFSAVAGTACCGFKICGGFWCWPTFNHDGIVAKSSVFAISLDHKYTRELEHGELPQEKEEVFNQLVLPILRGSPPPDELTLADAGPDSTIQQVISAEILIADSIAWTLDTITIEPSLRAYFTAIPISSVVEVELVTPDGSTIDSSVASADTLAYAYFDQADVVSYTVASPAPGDWIVKIRATDWQDTVAPVFVYTELENDVRLTFYDEHPVGETQDSLVLRARIQEAGIPILGCAVIVSAYHDNDTLSWGLELLDNGLDADEQANDGVYSGVFTESGVPGFYSFKCEANGLSSSNEPFARFAVLQTYVTGVARGDMNADGFIDAVDLAFLIDHVFFGTPAPYPDFVADVNCDGFADSVDLAALIDHVFFGSPAPLCP